MAEGGVVTTEQMWTATLVAALLVLLLGAVATARVRPPLPTHLPKALVAVGAVWFMSLYAWAAWTFWDGCYGAILPGWARMAAPFVGTVDAVVGWGFWWIARRVSPHRPVAPFLTLGGLLSLPGHLFGIYGRGLLEGCSVVRGVSPASALVFGIFEFALYWAVVLLVAHTLVVLGGRWGGTRRREA